MHHYKIGDRVKVLNQSFSGKPIVEGEAVIKGLILDSIDDYYDVEFVDEAGTFYARYIDYHDDKIKIKSQDIYQDHVNDVMYG